jgi:hypothetical protein
MRCDWDNRGGVANVITVHLKAGVIQVSGRISVIAACDLGISPDPLL